MQLRIRKIETSTSHNEMWVLFPAGDIMHPICMMYQHEMQELCTDIKNEFPEGLK